MNRVSQLLRVWVRVTRVYSDTPLWDVPEGVGRGLSHPRLLRHGGSAGAEFVQTVGMSQKLSVGVFHTRIF